MNQNSQKPDHPLYRVTFARLEIDQDGKEIIHRPKEIGAAWPRKNGKIGCILKLDIIPIELTQRQGIIFLVPADKADDAHEGTRTHDGRRGTGGTR